MKGMVGVQARAGYTTIPPGVRVQVRAPEGGWDGKTPIPEVMAAEHAIRDAAFYLYGRKTGPGFTLSLKPSKL